jgi:uncharacterized protein YjbJ (UPF0337 family)
MRPGEFRINERSECPGNKHGEVGERPSCARFRVALEGRTAQTRFEGGVMGDRKQRVKGKANVAVGKTKGEAGFRTGSGKTEAKGAAQTAKGRAQEAAGKARRAVKKKS